MITVHQSILQLFIITRYFPRYVSVWSQLCQIHMYIHAYSSNDYGIIVGWIRLGSETEA